MKKKQQTNQKPRTPTPLSIKALTEEQVQQVVGGLNPQPLPPGNYPGPLPPDPHLIQRSGGKEGRLSRQNSRCSMSTARPAPARAPRSGAMKSGTANMAFTHQRKPSDETLWLFVHEEVSVEGLDLVKLALDVMGRAPDPHEPGSHQVWGTRVFRPLPGPPSR